MRKIIVMSFITMDGVMQAPGGPEEDTAGGFKFGGWQAPYFDDAAGEFMGKLMKPMDLLLGEKTFKIFERYWPEHEDMWPGVNDVTKYAVSESLKKSDWQNTVFLRGVADIKKLKASKGSDLQVWGSANMIQTLLKNDLVDEMWLITHPITLGTGKKLFQDGTSPAAWELQENYVSPKGVIFANYKRAGEVKTGNLAD